jgi:cysteine-rich repeat protein
VNGCGGCGFLPAFPGTFCGVDHTWECNADGTMDCARTTSSVVVSDAVGGTTVVDRGQVTVPAGAVFDPIRITIRVRNGLVIPGYQLTSPVLEFGPAGTEFAQPLEVQIISDDAPASDMVWSNRATEGGGYSEVPGAVVEGDALVGDVNHFSIGFTGIPLADTELCGDGLDNDGDALADCDDSDCAAVPGCAPVGVEECGNGIDDDRDLFVDCDDSDCIGEIGCGEPPVESCNDGVDNDGDGMMDCADADCASDTNCGECASITCPVSGEVCGIGPDGPVCYRPCAGDADCGAGEVCTALGCAADSVSDAGGDAGFDGGGEVDAGADAGTDTSPPTTNLCLNALDQEIIGLYGFYFGYLNADCGPSCISDADVAGCASACVQANTGLTQGCSDCQGAKVACSVEYCLSECGADPYGASCETCENAYCGASYRRCSGAGGLEVICDDGLDNNLDFSADCEDAGCALATNCRDEICNNGIDDNGDGLADCDDLDFCGTAANCVETSCGDGVDNEPDGQTDCADSDCLIRLFEDADDSSVPGDWRSSAASTTSAPWSLTREGAWSGSSLRSGVVPDAGASYLAVPSPKVRTGVLSFRARFDTEAGHDYFIISFMDGSFEVDSGFRRSGTSDWQQFTLAVPSWADEVIFGFERDASGSAGADAVWLDEIEWETGSTSCLPPTERCADGTDNDGDTFIDCADADCEGTTDCREICNDTVDNDGDALTDCFDPACRGTVACPSQFCAGLAGPTSYRYFYTYEVGYGDSFSPCRTGEGCSVTLPLQPTPAGGNTLATSLGVSTYVGVCAPALEADAACGEPALGVCYSTDSFRYTSACFDGVCRKDADAGCTGGQVAGYRIDIAGNYTGVCLPPSNVVPSGGACGDDVGALCGRSDERCLDRSTLAPTSSDGVCVRKASSASGCPANSRFQYESFLSGSASGLCLPLADAGEVCGPASPCDSAAGLVCGAAGTCRPVVVGEGCATATALEPNTSGIGPDYFTVDRLDGLTEADESLNCSGTVGPEKVYFYTATSPVELAIEVGSVDGNGPLLSWYGRKETCTDIFAEAACGNASLLPTSGKIRLQAGETVYLTVDSAARWAGGDSAAAEFFLTVSERPVANEGGSCAAAVCDEGLNCAPSGICAAPSCGDALVDTGETCDDGNAVDGDGCTDCDIDVYAETEPNDTQGTANRVGSARRVSGTASSEYDHLCAPLGPHGGRITIRNISTGSCNLSLSGYGLLCEEERTLTFTTPEGCFYVLRYAADPYLIELRVEPFAELGEGESCGPTLATGAGCGDIGGAPAVCLEISPRVHAGTCELSTCGDGYTDAAEGEQCDDGNTTAADGCSSTCLQESYNEVEPNNGTLTARNLGGYREVSGTIASATDADYYKVTLTERSHLELSLSSTAFASASTVAVELLNAGSSVVFGAALSGYLAHSGARSGNRTTPDGYVYRAPNLAFLEPGTYTIRLASSATTTGSYVLSIRDIPTSVAPVGAACDPLTYKPCLDGLACGLSSHTCENPACGDGLNTVGEACDDGNTVSGDGCSSACALETYALGSQALDSLTPISLSGLGARYPFADGTAAGVVGLTAPSYISYHVSIAVTQPTRVRIFNVNDIRVWQTGRGSDLSPAGVQVAAPTLYASITTPSWLGPLLPTPTSDSWDCDSAGQDGVCVDATGGTDCMDCGARYGVDRGTLAGGEIVLPEGNYLFRLRPNDTSRPFWVVTGESPSERAQ